MTYYDVLTETDHLSSNLSSKDKKSVVTKDSLGQNHYLFQCNRHLDNNPFEKIFKNSHDVSLEKINIIEIFDRINRQFVDLQKEKNISANYYLNGARLNWQEQFYVQGDAFLIENLFYHLIKNAIELSPPNSKVKIAIMEEKDSVLFIIHNYASISKNKSKQVLEKHLICAHIDTTMLIPYNSISISEFHQGTINASSSKKQGTYFITSIAKNNHPVRLGTTSFTD